MGRGEEKAVTAGATRAVLKRVSCFVGEGFRLQVSGFSKR
jgi:hypothetical protein